MGCIQSGRRREFMKSKRNSLMPVVTIGLIVALGLLFARSASPPAFAQNSSNPNNNVSPFDFSDPFYKQNGINVPLLNTSGGRVGINGNCGNFGFPDLNCSQPNWVTDTSNTDPTRTSTRVLQTTGGFDRNGNLIYYSIMGTLNDDTFFDDADCPTSADPQFDFSGCGTTASSLANEFRAFIQPRQKKSDGLLHFPNTTSACTTIDTSIGFPPGIQPTVVDTNCMAGSGGITFGPAPPNRRQDNIFETKDRYFCRNLLGLWILTFTIYTPNAYLPNGQYASGAAQAAIAPIAAANGTNTDGTAVLKRLSEVDGLTAQGLLQQFVMPRAQQKSTAAPRYVV